MVDREKVIKGLECCFRSIGKACPMECPYRVECLMQDDEYNMYSVMHDALKLLKEQQKQRFFVDSDGKITPLPIQPHWISVNDDLPKEHDSIFANHTHLSKHMWAKESDNVIVYVRFPDGTGRSTEGRLQDGKWWTRVSPMLEPVVTHWMPLPEPPKEVKQDG